MILESILVNMYSPHRPHVRSISFIHSADERIKEWGAGLPDNIRLERNNMPQFCPPTNITVMK
jgi:hypothetical protein